MLAYLDTCLLLKYVIKFPDEADRLCSDIDKVKLFWEGYKIWKNIPLVTSRDFHLENTFNKPYPSCFRGIDGTSTKGKQLFAMNNIS